MNNKKGKRVRIEYDEEEGVEIQFSPAFIDGMMEGFIEQVVNLAGGKENIKKGAEIGADAGKAIRDASRQPRVGKASVIPTASLRSGTAGTPAASFEYTMVPQPEMHGMEEEQAAEAIDATSEPTYVPEDAVHREFPKKPLPEKECPHPGLIRVGDENEMLNMLKAYGYRNVEIAGPSGAKWPGPGYYCPLCLKKVS